MRSFIASLRTLTLPFGLTTGKRLLLDGVNGIIRAFNATNDETASMSSDSGFFTRDTSHATLYNSAFLNGGLLTFKRGPFDGPDAQVTQLRRNTMSMSYDGINSYFLEAVDDGSGNSRRVRGRISAMGDGTDPTIEIKSQSTDGTNARGITVNVPVLFEAEPWVDMSSGLANSWVADTFPPAYRKMADGTIMFRGWIKNGTTTIGTVFFTLPAGYRPVSATDHYFLCAMPQSNTNQATIDVLANGQMRVISAPAASIGLDQVRFMFTD